MEKKNIVTMVMGTLSGVLFALGMCMALLPEWNAFTPGVIVGGIGIVSALITTGVRRKMEGKSFVAHVEAKTLLLSIFSVVALLVLGVGMCMAMVWGMMVWGIVVGLVGIGLVLVDIVLLKGVKN
ncbi:MAG: hypothetical protein LKJ47_01620 [Bifidobacteriaceae bacterium]|jgi:hypothetical protein|nr:hypothetical protein [Bifidobacteriaceae bacterium]